MGRAVWSWLAADLRNLHLRHLEGPLSRGSLADGPLLRPILPLQLVLHQGNQLRTPFCGPGLCWNLEDWLWAPGSHSAVGECGTDPGMMPVVSKPPCWAGATAQPSSRMFSTV